MSLGCPLPLDPCEFIKSVPSQYQGSERFMAHITADIERLCCHSQVLADMCGAFNCDTATGQQLTMIGESIGWPRTHCNSKVKPIFGYACETATPAGFGCTEQFVQGYCEGVTYYCGLSDREDYTFTDDELYRSFIKAKIAKDNSGVTTEDICSVIQALWGADAYIYSAANGVIQVTAGRDLTAEEQCLIGLYEQIICVGMGIRLEVYCIAPPIPDCDDDPNFNLPPVCAIHPDQSVDEGVAFSYNAGSTDPNGDSLTYTQVGAWPAGISIDAATGIISGTSSAVGNYTLNWTISDGTAPAVPCSLNLTINEIITAITGTFTAGGGCNVQNIGPDDLFERCGAGCGAAGAPLSENICASIVIECVQTTSTVIGSVDSLFLSASGHGGQSEITSITVGGVTLLTSSATYGPGGWTWTGLNVSDQTAIYSAVSSPNFTVGFACP